MERTGSNATLDTFLIRSLGVVEQKPIWLWIGDTLAPLLFSLEVASINIEFQHQMGDFAHLHAVLTTVPRYRAGD